MKNATDRPRRGLGRRLPGALVGALTSFALALVALLAWKTQTPPWEITWFEDGRPSALLLALLGEARYEVLACALAALNLGWVLLQLGRHEEEPAPTPAPEEASPPAGATFEGQESVEPVEEAAAAERVRIASAGNGEAQLRIATSELARLRRELGSCRLELDAANAVKTQFLANMSHELRTPLNGIMGMTDLLLGGELPARERRFAQSIATSSNTLLAVISDLLDFSRIETGTLYLERSRFRVRDAVEDVCAMLADNAHAKGIELVCYVDENVPSLVDGDASRLRQVIDNLVRNAIAFTDEGEVVVRMRQVEERGSRSLYRCDVQDTGAGISPEMQMSMFDAFAREGGPGTSPRGGLGVGLTISRQLVAMMGGEITFRSRLGEGTRFGFTVELGNVEGSVEEETRQRPIRGARVLVVDDNETNRTILYHQLSGWGILADTADSGETALGELRRAASDGKPYDLLVLDLHMPGMDGVELARRIAADGSISGVPALMLTSALLDLDTDELAALGIGRYISKPPRQSVLHDSLVSLLPYGGARGEREIPEPDAPAPISASVLIVEDNLVSQEVAVGLLESVGCRVDVACDGGEAVSRASGAPYDLILMDCRMPGMDGYQATAAIRAGDGPNARTPIVALTANAMPGDRERCLEAGMDDYIAKPIRCDELHALLSRRVKRPAASSDAAGAPPSPSPNGSGDVSGAASSAAATASKPSGERATEIAERSGDGGVPAEGESAKGEPAEADEGEASSGTAKAAPIRRTLINPSAIDAIRGLQRPGKPDLLAKVLGVYFEKTPAIVAAMREALEAKDVQALKEQAHSLKSSSAYVGAEGLSDKCKRVERAAGDADFEEMDALVRDIAEEFEAVAAELGELAKAA